MILALEDFSYVVVVAVRKDYALPWTAYAVQHEHRRRKLQRGARALCRRDRPQTLKPPPGAVTASLLLPRMVDELRGL